MPFTRQLAIVGLLSAAMGITSGCARAMVSGRVLDAFGKGIEGVAVTVEGTSFAARTAESGAYRVSFVPGQFKLHVKKDGYTSATLPYTVTEATAVPAADVVLYPLPTEPGVFYVGKEKLERLSSATVGRKTDTARGIAAFLPGSATTQWFLTPGPAPTVLPEGDGRFVDTASKELHLFRAMNRTRVFLAEGGNSKANGLIEDAVEKVGDEQLAVHKVRLRPGTYGWVEFGENLLGGKVPAKTYYGFQVGEEMWFSCVGGYMDPKAQDGYLVLLWRDPSAGIVGEIHDQRLTLSDPFGGPPGLIEKAHYDSMSKVFSFRAMLGWANGAGVKEAVEFVGKLDLPSGTGEAMMVGSFKRFDDHGKVIGSEERTLLRHVPDFCSINPDRYTDLAAWRTGENKMLHDNEQPVGD
jgi:hypothetical protein